VTTGSLANALAYPGATLRLLRVLKLDTTGEHNLSYFTHEKNALSAAAGLATFSVIVDDKLPERAMRLVLL